MVAMESKLFLREASRKEKIYAHGQQNWGSFRGNIKGKTSTKRDESAEKQGRGAGLYNHETAKQPGKRDLRGGAKPQKGAQGEAGGVPYAKTNGGTAKSSKTMAHSQDGRAGKLGRNHNTHPGWGIAWGPRGQERKKEVS